MMMLALVALLGGVEIPASGDPAAVPNAPVVLDYDQPPRLIKSARPQYPREAFSKQVEGVVELEILIDATGRVAHVRVTKSIPLLDKAAVQCVSKWRFSPALKNGDAVATTAFAPITFRISDKPKKD